MTGSREGDVGSVVTATGPDEPAVDDDVIAARIDAMLDARSPGATMCPSDVARALAPHDEARWRALMPRVRAVAATLARDGVLVATRGGQSVDPTSPGGPIRLGRPIAGAPDETPH